MIYTKSSPEPLCLLIYEMIPEDTYLYLIPMSKLTKDDFATLKCCCGVVVNSTEMSNEQSMAAATVSVLIANPVGGRKGRFSEYRATPADVFDAQDIKLVVWTGFVV
jgi:hypothetical protein